MKNKVPQTNEDLDQHFKEQLKFLSDAAERYDKGDYSEAKLLAVHLRVLLHDTVHSTSLLNQLGIKDRVLFFDSVSVPSNVLRTFSGLVYKGVGPDGGVYVPLLDELPPDQKFHRVDFDRWWTTVIFRDNKGGEFTRQRLVCVVANQDGGAHIDPEIDESYVDLKKRNSLGWIYGSDSECGPFKDATLASIRQIAHEVLKSLIPEYPEKKKLNTQNSILLGDIFLMDGFTPGVIVEASHNAGKSKFKRGDFCVCGSGKKWRKCGYKETEQHKFFLSRK